MPHTTTIEIDGAPVPVAALTPWPSRLSLRLRGVSTLTLNLMGAKPGEADPYLGKPIVLKVDGDPVFVGDVVDAPLDFSERGWGKVYQCRDLRARADKFPMTDDNSLGSYATYNYDAEDPDKIDARLGRTVGQILEDVLTMQANAEALDSYGIGGYTSLSPPTLPAETLADLAAMTTIPPRPVEVGGDRFFSSISAFLASWAPNHAPVVRPDGVIRFLDLRAPTEHVLTFDACDQRVHPSGLLRSVADRYQRVVVRGQAIALPKLLTLSNGGLVEDFAWGSLSNSAAKAAWTKEDFLRDADARSSGSCSVTDLTHVVVTSAPASQTWGANEWDQSHRRGWLYVSKTVGSGFDQFFASRIVANTAKSSGGTSTLTLETPLPSTGFDKYVIYGLSSGASYVYRKYKAADPTIAAALANRMTYPVPYVNAAGSAASLVSYPQASVVWTLPGSNVPLEFPDPIVSIDRGAGTFLLATPTYDYNNAAPQDVRILAAVNTGVLQAIRPASGFEGTSHDVEGLEDTLTITMDSWRDPVNQAAMEAYAQEMLDAVKDAVVEGSIRVDDMVVPALTFGCGISIEAAGYATGWEGLNAPVTDVDLTWNQRAASHYTTLIQVSNRRAGPATMAYLLPQRRPAALQDGPAPASFAPTPPVATGFDGVEAPVDANAWAPSVGVEMDWTSAAGIAAAPDPGYTPKYDPSRKYKTPRKYRTATTPYRTPRKYRTDRKFSSVSAAELAAERAKARERREAESRARRELGASRPDIGREMPAGSREERQASHEAELQAARDAGLMNAARRGMDLETARSDGHANSANRAAERKEAGKANAAAAMAARKRRENEARKAAEARNAEKARRDAEDAGQDWRDAP